MHHRKKLRVTSAHYHANHLTSFWAAKQQGLFAQEGLSDHEWDLVYPGGVVPSEVEEEVLSSAMKEHGIDIVTDGKPASVFCQIAKGRELYIIGGWRTRSSKKALIGRKELASLHDLKGNRIGTRDLGAEGDTYFAFQLRKVGMDPERDVHWVRGIHSVSEAPDALRLGKSAQNSGARVEKFQAERRVFSGAT